MRHPRRRWIGAIVLAATLTLVGCKSDEQPKEDGTSRATATPTPTATASPSSATGGVSADALRRMTPQQAEAILMQALIARSELPAVAWQESTLPVAGWIRLRDASPDALATSLPGVESACFPATAPDPQRIGVARTFVFDAGAQSNVVVGAVTRNAGDAAAMATANRRALEAETTRRCLQTAYTDAIRGGLPNATIEVVQFGAATGLPDNAYGVTALLRATDGTESVTQRIAMVVVGNGPLMGTALLIVASEGVDPVLPAQPSELAQVVGRKLAAALAGQ